MAQTKSPPAEKKAWTLTFDEYKETPPALLVPKESVLAVSLDQETLESLLRFKIKELSALARMMGARRSGKKAVIIASILSRYHAFKKLASERIESLQVQKVVELNARLLAAGLPYSYGNKKTKARVLIDWRNTMHADAKNRLARSLHELGVSCAIGECKYQFAIAEGVMGAERAEAIVKSAGIQVPVDLTDPPKVGEKKKGGRATRALEAGEIQSLFAQISGRYAIRDRTMLMVAIHMALRANEGCGFRVGDVYDGSEGRTYVTIRGETAKFNKERTIRLGDDVKRVIADFIDAKKGRIESLDAQAPLFVSQMGGHLSRITLFVIVKKIMAKAGIKESAHALRKTGATIYYQQSGYDLMATQRFLGHASPSVTHRYIGVTPEQANEYAQRAAIALIAAVETGESEKLNTMGNRFNFPHSGVVKEEEFLRLQNELFRKDQIIDYLLKLLDRHSSEVQVKEVGDVKIVPIDYAIRAASASKL